MNIKICSLIIMAIFVSFLGFLVENIWLSITKGYIDNRNMILPFLIGYGLFIIGLYLLIGTPDTFLATASTYLLKRPAIRKALYFATVFLIISIGEILLGFFTERYFGFYYWNYECLPMHLTRYTSVPTSCGFTIIITLFMQECFFPILEFIYSINTDIINFIAFLFIIVLFLDFIVSFQKMHKTHKPNLRWKKYVTSKNNFENNPTIN